VAAPSQNHRAGDIVGAAARPRQPDPSGYFLWRGMSDISPGADASAVRPRPAASRLRRHPKGSMRDPRWRDLLRKQTSARANPIAVVITSDNFYSR
jgi:hypothetical protein